LTEIDAWINGAWTHWQEAQMSACPVLMHTALDATDGRSLVGFYRQFLGLRYRPGDESPAGGRDDDSGWLVLLDPAGHRVLAFQEVPALARLTWPAHDIPKQMRHDFRVPSIEELQRQRQRAEELGATLL
jgi:Glyoxalase-like domain